MVRFRRDAGLPSRRCREAARRRRRSDRERDLKLESLEPRLALASVAGLPDTVAPVVRSITLPPAGTYGGGVQLTFKVNFSEPVKVSGSPSTVTLPVEVGYAMREARYVSGSGTPSLTFRLTVAANDLDTDGISLGRVNSAAIRDFDFNKPSVAPRVLDLAGNPARNAVPAVNTGGIRVDATGPVVASYAGFATSVVQGRQRVALKVTFDGPVTVTGRPTVPVTIGGQSRSLAYAAGSGTSALTFAVTLPKGASAASPAFRGTNGLPGEVILLPAGADLKDRFGNSVTAVGGDFGKSYTAAGNRVVVMGTHFEKLGTVSQGDLNTILNDEQQGFLQDGDADSRKDYAPPVFAPAKNDVDLYRVAYRSTIPEQGNRPTVAYGLVAIPKGATGKLPLVSYQHGQLLLKESAPSQAFSWDKTEATTPVRYGLTQKQLYDSGYETRLNVAQFAGNGYAVIAADSFGLGNSIELDGFLAKQSGQQACLDMHAASQKLLKSMNLTTDKLFLNGWSTGGVATLAFQEALEARGVEIDGVSTSAAPSDMEMFVSRMIFNPRPYSTTTVPDGPWNVAIPQAAAFSLGAYGGKPGAALQLFGGNYDFARTFFMREFKTLPEFTFRSVVGGTTAPVMTMDGVTRSAEPAKFIARKFGSDPRAYATTAFAGLVRDAGAGKTRLESTMRLYYGLADEGATEAVATFVPTWQRANFGKTNIEEAPVPYASHRGAALSAAYGQLEWFDGIRTGSPAPGPQAAAPVVLAPVPQPPLAQLPSPFFLPPAVNGIVEVSGDITADTTLSAGTVYVITGEVHVRSGVTLSIEDGVEVRIRNGRKSFATLTSRALIFDSGSSLVAQNVIFQAANDANEPVQEADNGGVFFCGGTRNATKDDVSSQRVGPEARWSFQATSIVANFLGRRDPAGGDGLGNARDDIDAVSVIGAVAAEWKVNAVEINHSGDDGFDLTDSNIEMESVKVVDPTEDGVNLTSSELGITKWLEVEMTDSTALDREIFDFEGPAACTLTVSQLAWVDIRGYWDNSRFDAPIYLSSADMTPPDQFNLKLYAWKGRLEKSDAVIFRP